MFLPHRLSHQFMMISKNTSAFPNWQKHCTNWPILIRIKPMLPAKSGKFPAKLGNFPVEDYIKIIWKIMNLKMMMRLVHEIYKTCVCV